DLNLERVPIGLPLGRGDVTRGLHELGELRVGDVRLVHPEAAHAHAVRGPLVLLRELVVAPHKELAARNPRHAFRSANAVAFDNRWRTRRSEILRRDVRDTCTDA